MKFKVLTILACACAIAALAIAAGCSCSSGAFGGKAIEGSVWHFESMKPTEKSLEGLDDKAKADRDAEAQMLSVFMSDAQVEFANDGTFVFTFLGDKYNGKWEKADGGVRVSMGADDYSSAAGLYSVKDNKLIFAPDDGPGRLAGYEVTFAEGAVQTAVPASGDSSTAGQPPASETSSEAVSSAASEVASSATSAATEAASSASSAATEASSSAASQSSSGAGQANAE